MRLLPTAAAAQRSAWAALTIFGVLLTFAPVVLGLRTLSQRDTDRLYAPVRTLVVEALREGRLPLWNPYEGTGKPLFAEGIHSVLHPISLLAAALAPTSIDFLILGYLVAAALGAFLLARALGASPEASAGAGLAFALSGYSVSMTGNLVFLAGLSTLPWLLAAARTAGGGHRWGPVATALAAGSAFFSGDVQVALVGLALGLLLAADAGGLRGAARALTGMAVGALCASVQLLATYELLSHTTKGLDLTALERSRWALAPARLLEGILPGLFRGPPEQLPIGASGRALDLPFAESVYLGAPLLIAAGLGLRSGKRGTAILLAGAGATLLWLALGHHLGARQLLDWVPLWSRFRYAEKLMAPLSLCICSLGALGIDAFAANPLPRALTRAIGAAALMAGAATVALMGAPEATAALAARLLGDAGTFYRSTLAAGLPHLVVGLTALLAVDRLRTEPTRRAALGLLVAAGTAVAVYRGAHLGSHDVRRYETPLRLETDAPSPRIGHPESSVYLRGETRDFVEWSAQSAALLLDPAVGVAHRVDTVGSYGGFESLRLVNLHGSFGARWAREFRRFGMTHVVVPIPHTAGNPEGLALALDGGRRVQREPGLGFHLIEVPHRPWAFLAERAIAASRPEEALELVLALADLEDPAAVVVEVSVPPPTSPGRVLQIERGTQSVRILAESQGDGLLVVQDAYWPGWLATVDGQPAPILAADYLVRAVPWPAGRHVVEMTYAPPELRLGLALSGFGAVLALALAVLAARGPRQRA